MIQNYHDSIAICRIYGPPDFFVIFTCNSKWPEISEGIFEPGQKPTDRADIIVRVYHMKLEDLLHDIRKGDAFGACDAGIQSYLSLSIRQTFLDCLQRSITFHYIYSIYIISLCLFE